MAGSRNAGTIFISIQLRTAEIAAQLNKVEGQFKKLAASARDMGRTLTVSLSAPLGLMATSAVKSFAQFDQAMTNSMSVMKDVSKEMEAQLVAGAESVAKATGISAAKAAEGYFFLASSGLSAEQSIAALPKVAAFATAGQMDLAKATELLSDAQASLGLRMEDPIKNMEQLTRVSDVLTKANIVSNGTVEQFGEALAKVGGTLQIHNQSLEEGTAVLAAFAQGGLKGVTAGTALSIVLRDVGEKALKNSGAWKKFGVDVYEANGQMRDIGVVVQDMAAKLKEMSPAMQIATLHTLGFTQKSNHFIQKVIAMADEIGHFREEMFKAGGSTEEIANKQMQSFLKQLAILQVRLSLVAKQIGAMLAPAILDFGNRIVTLLEGFMKLNPEMQSFILKALGLLAVIGPINFAFGTLAKIFGGAIGGAKNLFTMFSNIGKAGGVAALGLSGITLNLLRLGPLLTVASIAWVLWGDNVKAAISSVNDSINSWIEDVRTNWPVLAGIIDTVWMTITSSGELASSNIQVAHDKMMDALEARYPTLVGVARAAFQALEEMVVIDQQFFDGLNTIGTTLDELGGKAGDFLKPFIDRAAGEFGAVATEMKDKALTEFGYIQTGGELLLGNLLSYVEGPWVTGLKSAFASIQSIFTTGWQSATSSVKGYFDQVIAGAKVMRAEAEKAKEATQSAVNSSSIYDWGSSPYIPEEIGGMSKMPTNLIKGGAFGTGGTTEEALKKYMESQEKGADKAAKAIEKTKEAMDDLHQKMLDIKNENISKAFEEGLETAIENQDYAKFAEIKEQLRKNVYDGAMQGLEESIAKAGGTAEARSTASAIATEEAGKAVEKWEEKARDASKKIADQHEKDLADAYNKSLDFWSSTFESMINGDMMSLEDTLKQVAVGFAAELAAQTSSGIIEGIGSLKGLGGVIAKMITSDTTGQADTSGTTTSSGDSGGTLGKFFNSIFSSGQTNTTSPEYTPSEGDYTSGAAQGPAMEGGGYTTGGSSSGGGGDYVAAGMTVVGNSISAEERDKKNQDNSGTGAAIGSGIGAVIGAIFGNAAIGAKIGEVVGTFIGSSFARGSTNVETLARHAFAGFIEDSLDKLSTVAFYDSKNQLQTYDAKEFNFKESLANPEIMDGTWADKINALGDSARTTFLGLGEAMEEVLGLTEDVGAHIGFMLSEQFGGNVDNVRLLVQQLGLDMDTLIEKLIEAGVSGEMTWLEVETGIQGVTNAFAPGLVAVADYKGAWDEFIASGGRGIAAIKALKDIGEEAFEANIKSLADLKAALIAKGVTQEEANDFFLALEQRGITSIEQLRQVTNREGGGITADFNALNETIAKTWQAMGENIDAITKKLNDLPTDVESNVTLKVNAELSDDARRVLDGGLAPELQGLGDTVKTYAKGGLVNSPQIFADGKGIGLRGEAGPEFIMPAHRMGDGSLGVRAIGGKGLRDRGGMNITVYAPNSAPGQEQKIAEAIRRMGEQSVSQAVDIVERRQRGGRR